MKFLKKLDKLEIILVVVVIILFGQEKVGINGENFHVGRSKN
jgi:Sec-independent protein translocase protein TatA